MYRGEVEIRNDRGEVGAGAGAGAELLEGALKFSSEIEHKATSETLNLAPSSLPARKRMP